MLWRNDGASFTEIGRDTGFASDDDVDYTSNEFYRCYCKATGACEAPAPLISCPPQPTWTPGWDDQPFRLGGNTFGTACADLDNDGQLDLVNAEIRHAWAGGSSDASRPLFQQAGGAAGFRFVRPALSDIGFTQPHASPDWDEGNIRLGIFDFDNDGLKDVYLGSSDYPDTYGLLFHNTGHRVFEEISTAAGVHVPKVNHMSLGDFDGDGDADLIAGISIFRDAGPYTIPILRFYRNDVGQSSNFTSIRLVGHGAGGANVSGIGAVIEVDAGGVTRVATIDGGFALGVQSGLSAMVGLGDACTIDAIRVHWPDAAHTVTELKNVLPSHPIEIAQDGGTLRYV
jgi:hypothetical protein